MVVGAYPPQYVIPVRLSKDYLFLCPTYSPESGKNTVCLGQTWGRLLVTKSTVYLSESISSYKEVNDMNEKFLGKIRRPQVYNDHARDIIWGEGCNAQNIIYGFRCTRVKGHLGPHEARGLHNNSFMIWW